MAPAYDRSVIRGRLRISKEDRQGDRTENTSPERRRSISDSGGSTRRRMRCLLPLLLSLALPGMAPPKYKIQARNQFLIFSDLKLKFPVSVCYFVIWEP